MLVLSFNKTFTKNTFFVIQKPAGSLSAITGHVSSPGIFPRCFTIRARSNRTFG